MTLALQSLFGFFALHALAWLVSERRGGIAWRPGIAGMALTVPLAAVTLGFSTASKRGYVAGLFWASLYFGGEAASSVLGGLLRASWPKLLSWRLLTTHLGDLCWRGTPPRARILECGWGPPLAILALVSLIALALAWRRLRSVEAGE